MQGFYWSSHTKNSQVICTIYTGHWAIFEVPSPSACSAIKNNLIIGQVS